MAGLLVGIVALFVLLAIGGMYLTGTTKNPMTGRRESIF